MNEYLSQIFLHQKTKSFIVVLHVRNSVEEVNFQWFVNVLIELA